MVNSPNADTQTSSGKPRLNIYGAGKLGQTLGYLWRRRYPWQIHQVICQSAANARSAVEFIGAGTAVHKHSDLQPAELWLIATPDDAIASTAHKIAPLIRPNDVVFHCSGSLASHALQACQGLIASVHPVHSFALPYKSISEFAGSYCTAEGDTQALEQLLPAFQALGANTVTISSDNKSLYHAGTVIACNYLTTLLDASLEALQLAGIGEQQGKQLLAPLMQQTLNNGIHNSTPEALTGPIARGDSHTVAQHLQTLASTSPQLHTLYQALGQRTLPIAEKQSAPASPDALQNLQQLLHGGDAINDEKINKD